MTGVLSTHGLELPDGLYLLGKRPVACERMGMKLDKHILVGPEVPQGDGDGDVCGVDLWLFIFDSYDELAGGC